MDYPNKFIGYFEKIFWDPGWKQRFLKAGRVWSSVEKRWIVAVRRTPCKGGPSLKFWGGSPLWVWSFLVGFLARRAHYKKSNFNILGGGFMTPPGTAHDPFKQPIKLSIFTWNTMESPDKVGAIEVFWQIKIYFMCYIRKVLRKALKKL